MPLYVELQGRILYPTVTIQKSRVSLDLFQNRRHTLASPNAEPGKTKGMLLSEHLPH